MSPRRPASEELTIEQILDAARSLFAERGFHSISMREIARQLGCSHGAIYYHFKDKNQLFSTLVMKDFHFLDDLIEGVTSEAHQVEDILLGFIEFGLTHRHHFELMFVIRELITDTGDMEHTAMNSFELFARKLAIAHGATLPPQTVWSLFLAMYGFVVHYLHQPMSYDELFPMARAHVSLLVKTLN